MRSNSLTVTVAAAALAVLAGLTGCGPIQMGSAAIVGDHGISTATLADEVASLTAAYQAGRGAIQLQFPLAQAPQVVLGWLVRFRIREQMAAANGITVTRADSQRALASIAAQAQQNRTSLAALAVANGLPPDLLPELGRYQAIEEALVRQLDGGTLPTSQAALQSLSQQFGREQCLAAKGLNIRINPQFGRMDYSQFAVVPAPLTLSVPEGRLPSPAAVVARPPC